MRIRQIISLGAGVGLTAALAVACSAKMPAPYADVASFCVAKAQAECQIASTCGIDVDDCKAQRASICNTDAVQATTMGSRARQYTQANAQACIDAVNAAYGNGKTSVPYAQLVGPGSVTDLCERVFSGNASINAPCESSYDCAGTLICAPTPGGAGDAGAASFVCAPAVSVPESQFCANPGSICETDTYCALPAYQCEPAKMEGQPCDPASAPCVSTDRCASNTGVTGQTCMPRIAATHACQTSDDCAPSAPYCDPYAMNRCAAGLSFALGAYDCAAFMSSPGVAVGVADAGAGGG